jgi:signal transduction histidine kinase/CheY-like chemotaxis protein
MTYQIFNSMISLNFKDKFYETKYEIEKQTYRRKYNICFLIFLNCISIAITILLIIEYPHLKDKFTTNYSAMLSYISGCLCIIFGLLSILAKSNTFQKWLTYLTYIVILLVFSNFRYYCIFVLKIDMLIYTLIFVIEMKFRLIFFVTGLIDFVPGVYLQLIVIITSVSIFAPIIPLNLYFRMSVYACLLVLTSAMSYFFSKERKRSFYFNLSLKIKNDWYESIIDNMNSGFISIKDKEIQYYNKTLLGFLKKPSSNEAVLTNNENANLVNNININELFDNIVYDNKKINALEQVKTILDDKYSEIGDNFVFLGTKDVEVTTTSFINLEVFGRCYSSSHNIIDKHEFIFNDITRSKQIEQNNAEIKYKTLFLSKIAHEFKNPLLCISELVQQVDDNLVTNVESKAENNNSELLKQIKSLSDYLIILVKDMDYFSQKSTAPIEKKVEIDKVNLTDIVNFCKDIVNALIQKSHKQANLTFQVIRDTNIPIYIKTDEIKLKQILINLLSNAVKYTYNGSINLKITLENKYLKLQVNDTGKGISEMLLDKIFIPFSNEFDQLNKVSSGLGLSIVKELLELLGSKIEYTSTIGKGSSFWFSLELDDNDLNRSSMSDNTVKGTHFNEQHIMVRLNSSTNISDAKFTIIVVDDEQVIRQATIRLVHKSFKEKALSVKILEASDGIECIYLYFNLVKDGKTISFILSDETMVYMNGSTVAKILDNICGQKNISHVPFYILSAYENLAVESGKQAAIDGFFSKPFRKQYILELLDFIHNN